MQGWERVKYTLFCSKTTATQHQHIDRKKRKGKIVDDYIDIVEIE